jgi:membrane-associated phospholipid phosphatase
MDFTLARAVNRFGAGTIDGATDLFCAIGFMLAVVSLMLALVAWRDRPRARELSLGVALALITHFIVSEGLLKHGALRFFPKRVRPWMAHPQEISRVGFPFEDSSFPSSHAASATAVVFVFAWHYPRARVPAACFALLMAFARVHNGMHYPTDVLAGTLLGLGYGLLGVTLARRVLARGAPAPRRSSESS